MIKPSRKSGAQAIIIILRACIVFAILLLVIAVWIAVYMLLTPPPFTGEMELINQVQGGGIA